MDECFDHVFENSCLYDNINFLDDLKLGKNYLFKEELDVVDKIFFLRSKSDFINRDSKYNDFNFYSKDSDCSDLFFKLRHVIDESRDDLTLFRLFKKDNWSKDIAKKLNKDCFTIEEDEEGEKLNSPREYFLNESVNVPFIFHLKVMSLLNKNKKIIISETRPTTMWEYNRISKNEKETILIELDQEKRKYKIFHGTNIECNSIELIEE